MFAKQSLVKHGAFMKEIASMLYKEHEYKFKPFKLEKLMCKLWLRNILNPFYRSINETLTAVMKNLSPLNSYTRDNV